MLLGRHWNVIVLLTCLAPRMFPCFSIFFLLHQQLFEGIWVRILKKEKVFKSASLAKCSGCFQLKFDFKLASQFVWGMLKKSNLVSAFYNTLSIFRSKLKLQIEVSSATM